MCVEEPRDLSTEGEPPWPVVVIGAGAAGLFAGMFAAMKGARVLILESKEKPGAKIRVSGGGRCNILPSKVSLENFHSSGSVKTLRNILLSWPLDSVRAFIEDTLELPLALEETTGKLFPRSQSARDVVAAVLRGCTRQGVEIRGGARVTGLRRMSQEGFLIELEDGPPVRAERIVLASGGLSYPGTGSDGAGLQFASRLGHALVSTSPALVALTTDDERFTELSGVALAVRLRAVRDGETVEERTRELLFTHRGFSGPAVMDLSRHITAISGGPTHSVQLRAGWLAIPEAEWLNRLTQAGGRPVRSVISERLPRRLARLVVSLADLPVDRKASELRRKERERLIEVLTFCPLPITGHEGYAKAEVTTGGVPLGEVKPKTLESRLVPGLHFCGEILDVVGHIGGYNFLWAWVSGRRAGEAVAV